MEQIDLNHRIRKLIATQEWLKIQHELHENRRRSTKLQIKTSKIITNLIIRNLRQSDINRRKTKLNTVQWNWESVDMLMIPQQQNKALVVVEETIWETVAELMIPQ